MRPCLGAVNTNDRVGICSAREIAKLLVFRFLWARPIVATTSLASQHQIPTRSFDVPLLSPGRGAKFVVE